MYQVLARKWRPQSFDALVGQQHVARTLRNALDADRLAHAYIFSGVRGTGKTSAARILACCLNCENGPTAAPCNSCTPCREIAESRSIDVLEIDAASRTKVEQTRELLETLSYAPARDRYKILIIDEAHMLSKASFNALLKTLEEPPPRVLFILATTELHKILPTILSRCQVFEFRRVSAVETTAHLRNVCQAENISISDDALERIARAGEGSIRDALSVLERVIAFGGDEVTDDDVLQALGGVRTESLVRMMQAVASRNAAAMLETLDGVLDEGRDLQHFWTELLAVLRDLLVARAVPDRDDLLGRSREETAALIEAAQPLSAEDLSRVFQIVAGLERGLKTSSQPRFLFEATLIRLSSLGAVRPIEEVLASITGGGGGPADPAPSRGGGGGGSAPRRRPAPRATAPPDPSGGDLRDRLMAAVEKRKPLLSGILSHASRVTAAGGRLTVSFPADSGPLSRQMERSDFREVLAACGEQVCGSKVEVRVTVAEDDRSSAGPGRDLRAASSSSTARGADPGRPEHRTIHRGELLDLARSEPGVERLLHEFGAQVVDIRPLDEPRAPAADGAGSGPTEESA
jgi:DNA polymerase-3 subunit gamma/tau